ncbi:hypothetical protein BIW11_01463 [Tropilaelaps mercedesae]|uniref:Cyclin-dependent kinase 2-associated protein 1-like n=1 Tax=Tropilaelaps mercedesae TaxID=418985 RepID=A0A1V9XDI3_9ACAR|nr:hypothetical protein BIW11_01463 [Tropilaelaps mercedesae]
MPLKVKEWRRGHELYEHPVIRAEELDSNWSAVGQQSAFAMEEDSRSTDSPAVSAMGIDPMLAAQLLAAQQQYAGKSKYAQLLAVIEEIGRDIRPTYAGSRSSMERLKRGIVHARILVRECLIETERNARYT